MCFVLFCFDFYLNKPVHLIVSYMLVKETSEGHRFDSCWEHSDFFSLNPSMPVSLTEKHHLS